MNDITTLKKSVHYIIYKLEEAKATTQWARFSNDIDEFIQKLAVDFPDCCPQHMAEVLQEMGQMVALAIVVCSNPECEKTGWHDLLRYVTRTIVAACQQAIIDKTRCN